ncbi:MAG: hybrid sensor histidine kinase/response regulator [Chloroflexus sp.]|uniref:PAS domain-containing hybrid sensor histidine kinase/response regulator n=1 Tax=Chloroflexus sp. TaxID=1904827 RepID=UPI0021DE6D7E|nr:PAS domain-containing hybrid sensor histidine kinase/response regulator [Chloroflexus sp.]GIV90343.1 MAG: hybrid sensor histidine kinase/response regulator [Chloroflexus sp.]
MVGDTILLLLTNSTNRQLLETWLGHHYSIIVGNDKTALQQPFQLCIIDGPALNRYEAEIHARRATAHPIFLPFLLVTTRRDVHLYTRHLWQTVDELVTSPIEKAELLARIEILLRARRSALELNRLQQAMLSSTQTWLQLAVSGSQIGLWEWDLITNRVFFSPEWKAQLGYAADELNDSFAVWEERLHPDDRERCLCTLQQYLERPWPNFSLEFRLRHKDGSYRWIRSQAALIYDESGRPTHMLGAHLDLTERHQLEEERQHLTEQLFQSQKLEAIGALTSGIAHDLNNLLVPIIGFAELGMLQLTPSSELYTDFDQIRAAGIRATALTRQILAFSRRQRLEPKPVNLNQVISDFIGILRRLIGERITIHLQLAPSLPLTHADPGQLEQVLLNLVINARDAIEGYGTITISTASVTIPPSPSDQRARLLPGEYIILRVHDTGCGIEPDVLPRIFEPFFTTKPQGKGTGLGLATVFGIIKQYHGHIDVQSVPRQGTTFTMYLPILTDSTPAGEAPLPSSDTALTGHETVLVVDDEPSVLYLITSALRLYGYRVLEATDPQHGISLAVDCEQPIDLLIADVMLPGITGDELYRSLAAQQPNLRVLFISAQTDDSYDLPPNAPLLMKPFTLNQLLQKVRAALMVTV